MHLPLEELQGDCQQVMERVAGFLGISFEESLLTPTVLGQDAIANMTGEDQVKGQVVTNSLNENKTSHASHYELYWLWLPL